MRRIALGFLFATFAAFGWGSPDAAARACVPTLSEPGIRILPTSAAATGTIEVAIDDGCAWDAVVTVGSDFLSVNSLAYVNTPNADGPGSISYIVQPNQTAAARTGVITIGGLLSVSIEQPAASSGRDILPDDVIAGVGGIWLGNLLAEGDLAGSYRVFSPTGAYKEDLLTETGWTAACADDWVATGDLYGADAELGRVLRFSAVHPHLLTHEIDVAGLRSESPESVVFGWDPKSNPKVPVMYVGNADGDAKIHRWRYVGANWIHDRAYDTVRDPVLERGSDWIDLLADQRTLLYTSEGPNIYALDVVTGTVTTYLGGTIEATDGNGDSKGGLHRFHFGLRVLPPGNGDDILVAAKDVIYRYRRLTSGGPFYVVQRWAMPGEGFFFALSMPRDGTTFWSTGLESGKLYRFDIPTGNLLAGPFQAVPAGQAMTGLCVKREYTAAQENCGDGVDNDGDGRIDENCTPLSYPVPNKAPSITTPSILVAVGGTIVQFDIEVSDPNDAVGSLTVTVGDALGNPLPAVPPAATITGTGSTRTVTWLVPVASVNHGFQFKVTDPGGLFATSHTDIWGRVMPDAQPGHGPPALAPVNPVSVPHGTPIAFTLVGSDPDLVDVPPDVLTYSMMASPVIPPGPQPMLNSATGAFAWTPTLAQPGTYTFVWTVTDTLGLFAMRTSTITVINNRPPDCSTATVSPSALLWPANYRAVPFAISGAIDPDGDPVSITIVAIRQDEPTNTKGDGNTNVDAGIGVPGTGTGWVRSERIGVPKAPGNGRVYEILFTAADGKGGACAAPGKVYIGVPYEKRPGATAVDDGVRFNSLTGAPIP
jgi:hypothetical protein